ncbi:MAG: PqqD family protein [Candidatus Omnitrophica bacterium]|nr:PqqD family protein [Candidatus Omnitrophota bacterium]
MEIHRKQDIPWRKIEENALVVNPKTSLIYPLNPVASRIWELLDGQNNLGRITGIILKEYDIDKDTFNKDMESFILQLEEAGLIEKK